MTGPRIRVSAVLTWHGRILLCRHGLGADERWLLPGGGVRGGETLTAALLRELGEETGITADLPLEGPIAIVESISPGRAPVARHVVHVVFSAPIDGSLVSLVSADDAVRGHRLFAPDELDEITLHPPIQRFLRRFEPGDPCVYLGSVWAH